MATAQRLHVTNACATAPIWIAHETGASVGQGMQNVKIEPTTTHTFPTPDGVHAIRMWPKMGCNDLGNNCSLGSSGGPGQGCVHHGEDGSADYSRCGPPIDTKFEASWGRTGKPCTDHSQEGCDFIDMSLVDGYTLPFQLEIKGKWCSKPQGVLDCSELSLERCPADEHLAGKVHSLQANNPATGRVAGCYSPCSKLLMSAWGNKATGVARDPAVAPFCCPTPPISPSACRAGPIEKTRFVSLVRKHCKGAYSYAYDDERGLTQCDPTTQYKLTFLCPSTHQPHVSQPANPLPIAVAPIPWAPTMDTEDEAAAPVPQNDGLRKARGDLCVYPELKLCDVFVPGRSCQCDAACGSIGNCCTDYSTRCGVDGSSDGIASIQTDSRYVQSGVTDQVRLVSIVVVTAIFTSVLWVAFHLLWTRRQLDCIRQEVDARAEDLHQRASTGSDSDEAELGIGGSETAPKYD